MNIAGGYGKHKINSAYSIGMNNHNGSQTEGRKTLIQTVENVTGVTIDHYAEINLYGFDLISQALGGVPVCLNHAVNDSQYSGAVFPAGQQTLSGVQALQFVRQVQGISGGNITFDTIPIVNITYSDAGRRRRRAGGSGAGQGVRGGEVRQRAGHAVVDHHDGAVLADRQGRRRRQPQVADRVGRHDEHDRAVDHR